jgi:TonB family protein
MTGDVLGDAYGYGGLGSAGTGWGGGGDGTGGIGMGRLGTLGHGSGLGPGQSYGHGVGQGLRDRGTTGWTLRRGTPTVTGLLSPDAIRRVVLRNIGQVNHCYEQGLAQSPTAAGRVAVRFVIGGDGNVLGSSVSDNSLPLPSVGQCVANAVRRWQFPPPEGNGVVNVNYPFSFQPANP